MNDYNTRVYALAKNGVSEWFPNGKPDHAAAIIESMFVHSGKEVNIYSGELDDSAYANEELLIAMEDFLSKSTNELKILVQNPVEINSKKIIEKLKELEDSGRINGDVEIRAAHGTYAEDGANHFAIMDRRAVRYETSHTEADCEAVANFYAPKEARKLHEIFFKAFHIAKKNIPKPLYAVTNQ